jgi:hypothetical protein
MGIQGDKKGAPMTSHEHEARCRALRGGMTESEAAIIADLSVVEQDREDLRNSLQDAYDEMRGHGWYCETAMAKELAQHPAKENAKRYVCRGCGKTLSASDVSFAAINSHNIGSALDPWWCGPVVEESEGGGK